MLLKMDHVLAHVIGDYFIQSDWMAVNKTSNYKAITHPCPDLRNSVPASDAPGVVADELGGAGRHRRHPLGD